MSFTTESILEKKIPLLKWHQSQEYIYIDIFNTIIKEDNIKCKNNEFYLVNECYQMRFDFFDKIKCENINTKINISGFQLIIEKNEESKYFWTYLSKDNIYKNQIQVNWDKWMDEDEDEDNKDINMNDSIDMDQMMASMGGNHMNLNEEMVQNYEEINNENENENTNNNENENTNNNENENTNNNENEN